MGIDILAINKTKLDSTIKDNEVHLSGCDIVCKDRENGRNGGVSVFVLTSVVRAMLNSLLLRL